MKLQNVSRIGRVTAVPHLQHPRAVPEDMQASYFLKGIKPYPAAIVDWWGNIIILKEAASSEMVERIGKMLGVASYGTVFFASTLLSAKDTRETVVPGTLTLSYELGKAVRRAREAGGAVSLSRRDRGRRGPARARFGRRR